MVLCKLLGCNSNEMRSLGGEELTVTIKDVEGVNHHCNDGTFVRLGTGKGDEALVELICTLTST